MRDQIIQLNQELEIYVHAYYVLNDPLVSDLVYDQKERELRELVKLSPEFKELAPVLTKVGSDLVTTSARIPHTQKMLSLENKYTPEELRQWVAEIRETIPEVSFTVEPKVDGNSLAAIYQNRKLTQCLTRGDGESGEDVTPAMKASGALPLTLPDTFPAFLEVRGEVWMSNKQLERLNAEQIRLGKRPWASPRNLASGSMKLKDTEEVKRRGLKFLPWDVFGFEPAHLLPSFRSFMHKSHHLSVLELRGGFSQCLVDNVFFGDTPTDSGVSAVLEGCSQIREVLWHKNLGMPTDGIVIKVDNPEHRKQLGHTEKYPNWACAYKWQSLQAETTLQGIEWSISRQGKLSPVGLLEPTTLGGAVISRVNLNNLTWMQDMGIETIPCRVQLVRSGDVIPQITGVVK